MSRRPYFAKHFGARYSTSLTTDIRVLSVEPSPRRSTLRIRLLAETPYVCQICFIEYFKWYKMPNDIYGEFVFADG